MAGAGEGSSDGAEAELRRELGGTGAELGGVGEGSRRREEKPRPRGRRSAVGIMATVREAATAWLGVIVLLEEGMAGRRRECAIGILAAI